VNTEEVEAEKPARRQAAEVAVGSGGYRGASLNERDSLNRRFFENMEVTTTHRAFWRSVKSPST
jgi:hypothetical protein